MGKGEISLTDSYDSESSRVSDFLKEDHCQEIPVIMGRSFLENFSVNEKFEGYYLR